MSFDVPRKASPPPAPKSFDSSHLSRAGRVGTAAGRFGVEVEPGVTVRTGIRPSPLGRGRFGTRGPTKNEVVLQCEHAFRFCPVVNSAINLMTDLVCQGMEWFHPVPATEVRMREWATRVRFREVSRQYVNLMLRHGFNVARRTMGTLDPRDVLDIQRRKSARGRKQPTPPEMPTDSDMAYVPTPHPGTLRIPIAYSFQNPLDFEAVNSGLLPFSVTNQYVQRISDEVVRQIREAPPSTQAILPNDLVLTATRGWKEIPVDPARYAMNFFRKDDFEPWGDPVILPILTDVGLLNDMKMADRSALEGVMSRVRLWKLGLPEHKIQPGPEAFALLKDYLAAFNPGDPIDLLWDASLDFKESSPEFAKILGPEKYRAVLNQISIGLGLPAGLTGDGSSGLSSDALGLKSFVERLDYLQNSLREFWAGEARLVQLAFGDRQAAFCRFETLSLSDENNTLQVMIGMWDRNILSTEALQERIGAIPVVEIRRMQRELARASKGGMPPKIGAFTEPLTNPLNSARTMVGLGLFTPSEAGIPREEKAPGDKTTIQVAPKPSPAAPPEGKKPTPKGRSGQGRTPGQKDGGSRKSRTAKPRLSRADAAHQSLATIDAMLPPTLTGPLRDAWLLSSLLQIPPGEVPDASFALPSSPLPWASTVAATAAGTTNPREALIAAYLPPDHPQPPEVC